MARHAILLPGTIDTLILLRPLHGYRILLRTEQISNRARGSPTLAVAPPSVSNQRCTERDARGGVR